MTSKSLLDLATKSLCQNGSELSKDAPDSASQLHPGGRPRARVQQVFFLRRELDIILSLYGRKVAAGEWRDYAIDGLKEEAVFSIFRRASEMPIYRVVKRPKLAKRQGMYAVVSATGQILKRGQDLAQVLRIFDKRKLRVID